MLIKNTKKLILLCLTFGILQTYPMMQRLTKQNSGISKKINSYQKNQKKHPKFDNTQSSYTKKEQQKTLIIAAMMFGALVAQKASYNQDSLQKLYQEFLTDEKAVQTMLNISNATENSFISNIKFNEKNTEKIQDPRIDLLLDITKKESTKALLLQLKTIPVEKIIKVLGIEDAIDFYMISHTTYIVSKLLLGKSINNSGIAFISMYSLATMVQTAIKDKQIRSYIVKHLHKSIEAEKEFINQKIQSLGNVLTDTVIQISEQRNGILHELIGKKTQDNNVTNNENSQAIFDPFSNDFDIIFLADNTNNNQTNTNLTRNAVIFGVHAGTLLTTRKLNQLYNDIQSNPQSNEYKEAHSQIDSITNLHPIFKLLLGDNSQNHTKNFIKIGIYSKQLCNNNTRLILEEIPHICEISMDNSLSNEEKIKTIGIDTTKNIAKKEGMYIITNESTKKIAEKIKSKLN